MKKSLYATALKITYLVINLLETLNYLKITLTPKRRHLITERKNNYSFLVLCKSKYLIHLPKYPIRLVFIKKIIIQRAIHKRIQFGEAYNKYTSITLRAWKAIVKLRQAYLSQ
jgi:hypothetical protein